MTLTWGLATANTDGSALTDLTATRLYRGANCTSLAAVATVGAPAATYSDTGLASGPYCYALTSISASEGEGPQSAPVVVTLSPLPAPPTNAAASTAPVTVATTVYMEVQVSNGFSFLAVGTAPLGTPCDPAQRVNNFNVIPASTVTWTSNIHRLAALAACSVN